MRTIRMTLDEDLVTAVDRVVKKLGTSRAAFIRTALEEALKKVCASELEFRNREGYSRKPVSRGEFDIWESEQVWGDE
jgi:metal-responsive CopG/Arc/MetJ family transcriptional regulator